MVIPNQLPSDIKLPCIIQGRKDMPNTVISAREFAQEVGSIEICRFGRSFQANYEAFSRRRNLLDDSILPGYLFFFEEILRGDEMSVIVLPNGKPIIAENMILSFCVVLKENAVHRELVEFAEQSPEYGYRLPPKPPYCSITPQYLYDEHQHRMNEIMKVVKGYSLMYQELSNKYA